MMQQVNDIRRSSNPLIEMMYLKKEFNANGESTGDNVLVVRLKSGHRLGTAQEREGEFIDFLSNLDLLRDEIERTSGKFKRIDIQGPVMRG